MTATENLPLWSVADVHESLTIRSFVDSLERVKSDVGRLESLYDELGIRALPDGVSPTVDSETGIRLDRAIRDFNAVVAQTEILEAYVYATVATNTRDETAQALLSEIEVSGSRITPSTSKTNALILENNDSTLSIYRIISPKYLKFLCIFTFF